VEDVKAFFRGLQARSGELIGNRHKDAVLILAERTKTLLREIIMAGELSESELCEEEDKLNAQLERLEEKTRRATEDFERQTKSSVEEIKADVSAALEGQTGALASMVLSGGDASEHMRATVRAVLAESVKKRYTCKMEKYLDRIDAEIKLSPVFAGAGSAREADGSFADLATGALGGGLVGGLAAAGAGLAAPALGLALPAFAALPALTIGAVAIPVIGVALAGIGAVIGGLMGMGNKGESKEGEVRRQLRSQVFPGILRQVGENVEAALMENTEKLGNAVEDQIAAQREALTKALAETRALQKKESEEKETLLRKAEADLTRVDALCTQLCARLREGASHAG
jgi:hypothetical protein